ncbi:unnamed protein product [Adineta ricciae]|uniref:Uncharacterized protein n=1 Tax=Adineta ricciae TaxID=249248 RepID=A0A815KNT3_ADIRI|nr:unnamed protein product [Adineta ricciae]
MNYFVGGDGGARVGGDGEAIVGGAAAGGDGGRTTGKNKQVVVAADVVVANGINGGGIETNGNDIELTDKRLNGDFGGVRREIGLFCSLTKVT